MGRTSRGEYLTTADYAIGWGQNRRTWASRLTRRSLAPRSAQPWPGPSINAKPSKLRPRQRSGYACCPGGALAWCHGVREKQPVNGGLGKASRSRWSRSRWFANRFMCIGRPVSGHTIQHGSQRTAV